MKTCIVNNFTVRIGQSAKDNWNLLDTSEPHFYFFHLSSFPSCFVIIDYCKDDEISSEIIKQCAFLCKNNTKYKNLKNINVDYTRCDNIKKEDEIGTISYKSNKKVKQIKL